MPESLSCACGVVACPSKSRGGRGEEEEEEGGGVAESPHPPPISFDPSHLQAKEKQHTPSRSIYLGQQTHMNSSAHTPSAGFEVLGAVNAISLCRVAVCRMKDH
ncbi:unnamed protein product [Pleuronectes platessa]|uniref:Uncharacterized protein n=1 Tax=Pleuronectes platessa TaxID=8262 RepID=A0A9N7V2E6_PLEPL|nr:unnamed protein product [Pleuronectes platessa]